MNEENDDLVIRLSSDEFEAFSRALAAPPPASPALAKAMTQLKAKTVAYTATGHVFDWQPRRRR